MKKLFSLLFFVAVSATIFARPVKVESAMSYFLEVNGERLLKCNVGYQGEFYYAHIRVITKSTSLIDKGDIVIFECKNEEKLRFVVTDEIFEDQTDGFCVFEITESDLMNLSSGIKRVNMQSKGIVYLFEDTRQATYNLKHGSKNVLKRRPQIDKNIVYMHKKDSIAEVRQALKEKKAEERRLANEAKQAKIDEKARIRQAKIDENNRIRQERKDSIKNLKDAERAQVEAEKKRLAEEKARLLSEKARIAQEANERKMTENARKRSEIQQNENIDNVVNENKQMQEASKVNSQKESEDAVEMLKMLGQGKVKKEKKVVSPKTSADSKKKEDKVKTEKKKKEKVDSWLKLAHPNM